MSQCNLDHSYSDVLNKLESQQPHLPVSLFVRIHMALHPNSEQSLLNEVFHLLKKYDLASPEEKAERDQKLISFFSN